MSPDDNRQAMSLFPLLLVTFIGTLGFSIVLPFLVTLVTALGGNALIYGLMGSTYSAFQLVGAPILGSWSDTYGRRKILLLSQLGTLASWGIFLAALFLPRTVLFRGESGPIGAAVFTLPLVVLFVARAIDGLTGGNVSVANAYLADITSEDDRTRNYGRMAIAGNLGFIIGPALAGVLGATALGEVLPVVVALVISAVASVVIAVSLPESRPCVITAEPDAAALRRVFGQEQADCYQVGGIARPTFREVLRVPGIPYLLLVNFLVFIGFNLFYTAFPVHAVRGLQWSVTDIGFFFSFLGVTTIATQGPILSRATRVLSDAALTVLGSAILAGGFLLLISGSLVSIYAGAALFSLGNGLMWPSFLGVLSKTAGDHYQGAVQGYSGSVSSLASIVGLIGGGVLYDRLGGDTFVVSALVILVVCVLSTRLVVARREPPPAPAEG